MCNTFAFRLVLNISLMEINAATAFKDILRNLILANVYNF